VPISDEILQECLSKKSFSPISFELYKETATVVSVAAHVYFGVESPDKFALPRNQATCAGLLVRISKFMVAMAKLMVDLDGCGEVVTALGRSVMESATNLRFLVLKNEDRFFDQFVKFSLSPERELYDGIQKNIARRGGDVLPIEQRMMNSIDRVCKVSDVKIEEVPPKFRDWGGGFRNRLIALGEGERYAAQQGIQSHAVHGTWVDLVMRHLEVVDGGFRTYTAFMPVDSRVMLPLCIAVLPAARAYLDTFLPSVPELEPLYERLADLEERILKVNDADEKWRAQSDD
jgi:hypothetical protein